MERFQVVYDGDALREHSMEVRDLAPALMAIGQALEEANTAINGPKARIAVKVHGSFKTGSFGIDLSVGSLLQSVTSMLEGYTLEEALTLLKLIGLVGGAVGSVVTVGGGVIGLIKWLKGRPAKFQLMDNGAVRVTMDEGERVYEEKVIKLYQNYKLRTALERAIADPLEREGVESFAVTNDKGETFVTVEKSERSYFVVGVLPDQVLLEEDLEKNLQLVSVAFKDDNKWRFYDGASTFWATVVNQAFLNRIIKENEPITAGDILVARLHMRQSMVGDELRTEYTLLKVLAHRNGMRQIPIEFDESSG